MWIILSLLASMLWGLVYMLDERSLRIISPEQFLLLSCVFGTLVLTPYFLVTRQDPGFGAIVASGPKACGLVLLSLSVAFVANLLILTSVQQSNATLAAVIETCYPVFTFLFAWLIYRETQLTPLSMIGGSVTLLGILLTYLGSRG